MKQNHSPDSVAATSRRNPSFGHSGTASVRRTDSNPTLPSFRAVTPMSVVAATYGGDPMPVSSVAVEAEPPSSVRPLPSIKIPSDTESELERMNLKLKRQVAFLTSVFASSSDAMVLTDNVGSIIMFNAAAVTMFELDEELALRDNLFHLLDTAMSPGDGLRLGKLVEDPNGVANLRTEIHGLNGRKTPALLTLNYVAGSETPAILAVIKDNSEVESLARIDALTKLVNRREFDLRVASDYAKYRRGLIKTISCLFVDIDLFKQVNTKYGHHVGDEVIRCIGHVLGNTFREIDTAARYGGEEFVVILPGTDQNGARLVAERLRTAIEAMVVSADVHTALRITASIGVASHCEYDSLPEMLVQDANAAMRAAKEGGRNQVRTF